MSVSEIVVRRNGDEPPRRIRKWKRASSVAPKPEPEYDDDYVDPADEEKYRRQVRESDGFDVDYCPLPYGGIFSSVFKDKYDYPYDIGLLGRLGLHCYNYQKGTNLKLIAINKYNYETFGVSLSYLTLEAMDTSNNSPYNFQTLVAQDMIPEEASLMVWTKLSRLKVPTGCPRATPIVFEKAWKDEAVDDFYKGKMPSWLTEDELAAANENGQFYEWNCMDHSSKNQTCKKMIGFICMRSAEFAFGLKSFVPLEMKKVIIQTKESGEELPRMKLKANNAIFYMSFKGNGDPRGIHVEYQAIVRRTMDGMLGHICLEVDCLAYKSNCPSSGDEPLECKWSLETPSCSASVPSAADDELDDPLTEDDELDSEEEEEYLRQVRESDGFDVDYFPHPCGGGLIPHEFRDDSYICFNLRLYSRLGLHCYNLQKGTNLKLTRIHKYNSDMGWPIRYFLTLEAADTCNNTACTFQTCLTEHPTPEWGYYSVQTEVSRLKVLNCPGATPVWRWRDEAIPDFYKGEMPDWLTKAKLAAAKDKGQYYELQESDLLGNEWLHLYAEFAFYLRWRGHGSLWLFLPLKINKVIIQTQESGEDPPHLKLKAKNAIFYMSFKSNGDPSGIHLDYHAMLRKTMDGEPGHIGLEVQCWTSKSICNGDIIKSP